MFDSDQEFFDCPFCGNKFNVVDFHGDEIIEQAKESLKKKSFDAAKEKFKSVLENDPENFEALLGAVLCELHIKSIDDLLVRKVFEGRDIKQTRKLLFNAQKQAPRDGAKFFGKMLEIVGLHEKLTKLEKASKELSTGDTSYTINRKMVDAFKEEQAQKQKDRVWIIHVVFGGLSLLMIPLAFVVTDLIYVRIFFFTLCAVFVIWAFMHAANMKKIEESYTPAKFIARSYNTSITMSDSDYKKACRELNTMYPSSMRAKNKQRELNEAANLNKSSETVIDPEETIICSKCAARLILDKDKRVYQCNHCGVAYGVSLFFGLPMEKALNSMNTGRFGDAEQRYGNILMIHPSDFEALLGRILCAGKWTKISDIDLTDDVSSTREEDVKKMIGEALQHSSAEDRPYFENVEKLISLLGIYNENNNKLDEINTELSDFDAKAEVYSYAYDEPKYKKKRAEERSDILKKSYPYRIENKKIEDEFSELRRTILGMRNESALVDSKIGGKDNCLIL